MPFGDGLSVQDRNLLSRATSQNSDPTPGHLYKEILDLIKQNLNTLSSVEDYLLSRISRPEPYIKYKCIKLLKFLVSQFPQYINITRITSHSALLECRGYRCNYSEYNGDYLSNLIRTETSDFFQHVANMANALHGDKSFGVGNNLRIGNPKMEGFGNTTLNAQQQHQNSNSVPAPLKALSNIASRYLSSSVVETIEQVGSCITTSAMEQIEKHIGFGKKKQQFSQVPNFKHTSPVFRPQTQPSLLPNLLEVPSTTNLASNAKDSSSTAGTRSGSFQGNSEMKLVNDFLTFSGIKVTPSQHVLDDFSSRLKLLDATIVIEELSRRLNTRSLKWQVHLRILCVLDALVRRGDLSANIVEELKKQLAPMLVICKESPQLKNKCVRLESLLKINGGHGDDVLGVDLIGVGVGAQGSGTNVASSSASSRLGQKSRVASIESQFDDFIAVGKASDATTVKQSSVDATAQALDDFIGGVAAGDVLDLSWQGNVSGDSTRATTVAATSGAAVTATAVTSSVTGPAATSTTSGDAFENLFDSLTLLAPPEPPKASAAAPSTTTSTNPSSHSDTWNQAPQPSAQPPASTTAPGTQSHALAQTFQSQSDPFDPFGTPKNLNVVPNSNLAPQNETAGKSYTVDDLL